MSDCGPATHSPSARSSAVTSGKSSSERRAKSPPLPLRVSETRRSNRAGSHASLARSMGKGSARWRMA